MSAASDQLPRLLALVPYLLARPDARIADVAREFGVSEEQLVKDLNLIWMCGLPGYLPGDLIDVDITGDRVTVSNADTIARPLRLTSDEVLPLMVALRMLADLPGVRDRDAVESALAKLERAAGDAANAAAAVAVDVETEGPAREAVDDALRTGRRLHLRYYVPGRDETTERDVDPMRLMVVDGRGYLEGWCRRAEAVRVFRLDRVSDAVVLDVAAQVPAEARSRDLDAGLFQPAPTDLLVTLQVGPAGRWIADYLPCESVDDTPDGGAIVRLYAADPAWVRRLALRLAGVGRILDPPGLADDVRAVAADTLALYE